MTVVIMLGPPGVGKGTQAKWLAQCLGIPAISTGQIFRAQIEEGSELGILANQYMSKGEFVPDSVTTPMVGVRLSADDVRGGFVLDGYPRTIQQAHALRDILACEKLPIDVVLEFEAPEEQLIARMANRAAVEGRDDDTEEVFRHRLEVYRELIEPLATYYADQDLLDVIDGSGTADEVAQAMMVALRERQLCD